MPATAPAIDGPEWGHALYVAEGLRTEPPEMPVVLLLGGSSAREATVSDVSWAAEVQRRGASAITHNFGSRRQTFEQEVVYVKTLPRVPMVIYIGVNLGRFASELTTTATLTPPLEDPTFVRHHYKHAPIWTFARKQERIRFWLEHRYPIFKQRYAAHRADLERLVATCVDRGYQPVLLALPRNIAVIGDALDEPTGRYMRDCRRLATKYDVPFLDFVPDLNLPDEDFYDLDHLIATGQPKFEGRLAAETVRLIAGWPGSEPQDVTEVGAAAAEGADAADENDGSGSAGTDGEDAAKAGGAETGGDTNGGAIVGDPRVLWPLVIGMVLVAAGVVFAAVRRRTALRRRRASSARHV